MKLLILSLFILHCASAWENGFNFSSIQGIQLPVKIVEFDSDSNIYVVGGNSDFYKLNSKKEVVLKISALQDVEKIIVTPAKYVYAFSVYRNVMVINELSPNSTSFKNIYRYSAGKKLFFFMDKVGNILFNTKNGVAVLKNGDNLPRGIVNLEKFYIRDHNSYFVDDSGIYLGGVVLKYATPYTFSIAIITDISSNQPQAKVIQFGRENELTSLTKLGNNLILGLTGDNAKISKISYPYGGRGPEVSVLFSQYEYKFSANHQSNDTFYFFGLNLVTKKCYLNVGDLEKVQQLDFEFHENVCLSSRILSDKMGNIFFPVGARVYLLNKSEKGGYDLFDLNLNVDNADQILKLDVFEGEQLWLLQERSIRKINIPERKTALARGIGVLKSTKN